MKFSNFVIFRFGVVGLINTTLGLLIIYVSIYFFKLSPQVANFVGFTSCWSFSYFLNKRWTFKRSNELISSNGKSNFLKFLVASAAAYALNLITLWLGLSVAGLNVYLVEFFAVMVYALVSFYLLNKYVFPSSRVKTFLHLLPNEQKEKQE